MLAMARPPSRSARRTTMQTISANGATIPSLGFGTFRMEGKDVLRMVPAALRVGFRHVDTAQIYRNEAEVGEAIAGSGVPRGDIFLTTKVWIDNFAPDRFMASVDESLAKLRTDHVDLLLLHWPNGTVPLAEQIGGLNAVRDAGKTRHIGVSNYNIALLKDAISLSDAPLVTNQVEYHPFLDQRRLLAAMRDVGPGSDRLLCHGGWQGIRRSRPGRYRGQLWAQHRPDRPALARSATRRGGVDENGERSTRQQERNDLRLRSRRHRNEGNRSAGPHGRSSTKPARTSPAWDA